MKFKTLSFIVMLAIVGISTKFLLFPIEHPVRVSASDEYLTIPVEIGDFDQLQGFPVKREEGNVTSNDLSESKEDRAFEQWTSMVAMRNDMARRGGGGVTVFTAEESALVSNWQERTGQFVSVADSLASDYEVYDIRTLTNMGQQGDLKALDILIKKARINSDSSVDFLRLQAVVAGSLPELFQLGSQHLRNAQEAKLLGDDETFREELIEGLACAHMRIVRGESDAVMEIARTIQKYNIEDSSEFLEQVEQSGRKLYEKFAALRREKGWGEFDNSVPVPVKRMHANNICKNEKSCVGKILGN